MRAVHRSWRRLGGKAALHPWKVNIRMDCPAPTYLDMMRHNAMTLAQALAS